MSAYDWDPQAHRFHEQQQQRQEHPQQFPEVESPPEAKGGSKRSRQTYSKYQTAVLETVFQTSKYIVRSKRQQMSAELSLTERQIKIWFQNRRMKEKKCHKEVPRIDCRAGCPATAAGFVDDFAAEPVGYRASAPSNDSLRDGCTFARDFQHHGSVGPVKPLRDHGGYDGYGAVVGFDPLTPDPADPYAVVKQQQWPPAGAVDFHQDFYGDHNLSSYQRMPMTAHHHMNSQLPDYCSPHMQTAHGY